MGATFVEELLEKKRLYIKPSQEQMGSVAATHIAAAIRSSLQLQKTVRMIFAAAPSQLQMLHALALVPDVDWSRVEAFHMDEYIGLPDTAEQNFRLWLQREFFDRVPLGKISLITPGDSPEACAASYAKDLAAHDVDIVCMGIGVNGHLAFNDPPAEFDETADMKIVKLEIDSRKQQVFDGLFTSLELVPTHAVTLTIPRLLRSRKIFCCVPGAQKEAAVTRALTGPLDPGSPASALRRHPDCQIYLDEDSAKGLREYLDARLG